MRKWILAFFCFCAFLGGFWFVKAHYIKREVQKIFAKSHVEYANLRTRGFPFNVVIHLDNPQKPSLFSLNGSLCIGSSFLARRAWLEWEGEGLVDGSMPLHFSGKGKGELFDFWTLIRNRRHLSPFSLEGLSHLPFQLIFNLDPFSLQRGEQKVSFDRLFLKIKSPSIKAILKKVKINSPILEKYYFSHPFDICVDLKAKWPESITFEKIVISDPYFRNKFSGTLFLEKLGGKELVFKAAQEVKRAYTPEIEKEHIARLLSYLHLPETIKIPERKLFGVVECQGDVGARIDSKGNWEFDIHTCQWKFGKYQAQITGKINTNSLLEGLVDFEFWNYLALKSFIAKKLSSSMTESLAFWEKCSSSDNPNVLKLQFNLGEISQSFYEKSHR